MLLNLSRFLLSLCVWLATELRLAVSKDVAVLLSYVRFEIAGMFFVLHISVLRPVQ